MPFWGARPVHGLIPFLLLYILLSGATLANSPPAAAPPPLPSPSPPPPPPPPPHLHARVPNSHPIDTCTGNHAAWSFQQSVCQTFLPNGLRTWRMYCHAPGAASMLEGPVPWWQFATIDGACLPSQLCVDGPYQPPDMGMYLQHWWYKQHGTAHCVEMEYLVGLGRAGLEVMLHQARRERGEGVKGTGIYPPGAGIFA
ncbi:hypothetical protein MMC34_005070 [Xylographa carneopallida]|nr:hypothetical protein [Xylographa carneopallida]